MDYEPSTRKAMDVAFVGATVLIELNEDDRISKTRIAPGEVAPTPIRVASVEKPLQGGAFSLKAARESAS